MAKDHLDEQPREAYHRWQDRRIQHMGFTTNLILTLAVAEIGFLGSDLSDLTAVWPRRLAILAVVAAGASTLLGIFLVLNRLKDFRTMARLHRVMWEADRAAADLPALREKSSSNLSSNLDELNAQQVALGPRTWRLFRAQLWTWIGSVAFLALGVAVDWV